VIMQDTIAHRRFRRRTDKAMLGGVCAGLADYFGLNLRITRILTAVAFFAMPITIVAYIGILILVPAESSRTRSTNADEQFNRSLRSSPTQTMRDVRSKFQSLDRRLAQLEKHVTSPRYQLNREIDDL
jgi:phage shock protein C